jgi:hypothetical protein
MYEVRTISIAIDGKSRREPGVRWHTLTTTPAPGYGSPSQRWAKWRPPTFDIYLYLRHIPLPSTQEVDDTLFLKKVGSRGQCLLPSIFGKVEVQGTIFDFSFSKKFDFSLFSTLGRALDRWRAIDLFASVDAHLCCGGGTLHEMPTGPFWEDSGTYPPETMAVSCTPGGLFQKSMHAAEGSGILKRLYDEKHRFFPKTIKTLSESCLDYRWLHVQLN